ncbi:MAG: hypothetical protein P9M06_05195 [Candidatus Saelkia tenebricola]|nr:hypothetical protein [Candidatus Saelkia tenebricola]
MPITVKTIVLIFVFLLSSQFPSYSRRTRDFNLEFFQAEDHSVKTLNQHLAELILTLPGVTEIHSITEIKYLEGDYNRTEEESWGAYEFSVATNKGTLTIIVKPITEEEALDFQKASLIKAAPNPAKFIPSEYKTHALVDGYMVYPYFEGEKLSKICVKENGAEIIKENPWIITQLATKLARLKHAGIRYEDFLYYNTIIDLEREEITIIDFGRRACASPEIQIRSWFIPSIFHNDPDFREQVLNMFHSSYQEELEKLQNIGLTGSSDN